MLQPIPSFGLRRGARTESYVVHLRNRHAHTGRIEQVDGKRTERAAQLDDASLRGKITSARGQETDIHVCGGHRLVGARHGHDRKARGAVRDRHEQPAMERLEHAVEPAIVRHCYTGKTFAKLIDAHTQRIENWNLLDSIENRGALGSLKHVFPPKPTWRIKRDLLRRRFQPLAIYTFHQEPEHERNPRDRHGYQHPNAAVLRDEDVRDAAKKKTC